MPRTPTIFLNNEAWKKLEKKVEAEGYPSKYAYIKDLILKDLNEDNKEDVLKRIYDKLGLGEDDESGLIWMAWKEFVEKHGFLQK